MVGADHNGSFAPIRPMSFQKLPQPAKAVIRLVQCIQNELIVTVVSPIVPFPETQEEYAWLMFPQMGGSKAEGINIVADTAPGSERLELQLAHLANGSLAVAVGLESSVNRDRSLFVLCNPIHGLPGAKGGDTFRRQVKLLSQEF